MRANEFICERISFSHERNNIANAIQTTIDKSLEQIAHKFEEQFTGDTPNYDTTYEWLDKTINILLLRRFKARLSSLGISILKLDPSQYFNVDFDDMNVGGEAYYDYIKINKNYILKLAKLILDAIMNDLMNNDAIRDNDNNPIVPNVKYAAKVIKETDFDIHNWKSADTINNLITTYIHELVHIKQHSHQNPQKPTEYRSYATKDKEHFYSAIKNITQGNASKQDWKLYTASPQEIPAFAHNSALDIIHSITELNTDKITDVNDLKYYVEVLNDYIKGGRFAKDYINKSMPYYSSTFNNKNSKDFKVFKRFYKNVAVELMNYRDKLINQLGKTNET